MHAVLGVLSFSAEQIQENVQAFLSYIEALKPVSAKGTYVKNISLTATMSPGIPLAA